MRDFKYVKHMVKKLGEYNRNKEIKEYLDVLVLNIGRKKGFSKTFILF